MFFTQFIRLSADTLLILLSFYKKIYLLGQVKVQVKGTLLPVLIHHQSFQPPIIQFLLFHQDILRPIRKYLFNFL
jgi:hypothetical protein